MLFCMCMILIYINKLVVKNYISHFSHLMFNYKAFQTYREVVKTLHWTSIYLLLKFNQMSCCSSIYVYQMLKSFQSILQTSVYFCLNISVCISVPKAEESGGNLFLQDDKEPHSLCCAYHLWENVPAFQAWFGRFFWLRVYVLYDMWPAPLQYL